MTTTMSLISKQTVGASGAASITFSNIPQTFNDLKVLISGRTSVAGNTDGVSLSINGSNSNLSGLYLFFNSNVGGSLNAGTAIGTQEAGWINGATSDASTFSNVEIYFPNYKSTTTAKPFTIESTQEKNATGTNSMYMGIWSNLWNPPTQAAITSLTFTPSGSFSQYTTIYLYGISNDITTQNTSVPYASGGDVITTDGNYWYHAFKTSGSFVPQKNLSADILVVAGGGSGGTYYRGGGGGAGGLKGFTAQSLTSATSYTCTIGAGATGSDVGRDGSNSQFGVLTAAIGGGGGGDQGGTGDGNGRVGGSGGGGGQQSSSYGTGGAGTSGQGNAGGDAGFQNGGGGGGAGAIGGTGGNAYAGTGGNGSSSYSSWLSATATGQNVSNTYYIAGGGSGAYYSPGGNVSSAAGYGGGGTGGSAAGTAGTANTGGGGGGSNYPSTGGNGGSGIIIVRYPV